MKKAYTASSLKTALEKIQDVGGVLVEKSDINLLRCPILKEFPFQSMERCFGNPRGCQRARSQTCQRVVRIHVNDNMRFCWMISAWFTVPNTDNDGYVEKADRTLRWLIEDKKLINEHDLVAVEV